MSANSSEMPIRFEPLEPRLLLSASGIFDAFEANDNFANARDLHEVSDYVVYEELNIHTNDDMTDNEDFFKFKTSDDSTSLHSVRIEFTHSDGDLDIELYNQSRNYIAGSFSTTDNESISLNSLPAGVLYLRVKGFCNATASYKLIIEAPANPLTADELEDNNSFAHATDMQQVSSRVLLSGLTIHANGKGARDEDYFRFETLADGTPFDYVDAKSHII